MHVLVGVLVSALALIQEPATVSLTNSPPPPTAASPATPLIDQSGVRGELISLTQQYLTDQVNSVTERPTHNRSNGTNELPLSKLTGTLSKVIQQEVPEIRRLRDGLRGTESEFDWGKADLVDPHVAIVGPVATMIATERSRLHYKALNRSTYYTVKHIMQFINDGAAWSIANDYLDDLGSIDPAPYERTTLQATKAVVSLLDPNLAATLDPQNVPAPQSTVEGLLRPPKHLPKPAEGPDPYNGEAAANYADEWTDPATTSNRVLGGKRNPDYIYFPNDCTNFVSQALRAGGWTDDVPNEWYARQRSAFVSGNPSAYDDTGAAWRIADRLYHYGLDVSHRFAPFDPAQSHRGDIVFADWARNDDSYGADGEIDHSMVVTIPGTTPDWHSISVTYHSSDQNDLSLRVVAMKQAKGRDQSLMRFFFMRPVG